MSGYMSGIATRRAGLRQLLQGTFAAVALLMTVLAFIAPARTLVPDAASGIVGQAIASAGIDDAAMSIAWSAYIMVYALLLLAALGIWLAAIALMIWPPVARKSDRHLL
jgi:hypothetical protein